MLKTIQFKVEKGRVLVPVGEPCPFSCKYCYTRSGEVGPPRVTTEEILRQFEIFAQTHTFETIQFGYDGDPFADPERGLTILESLIQMGKHVNFSTKALIEGPTLHTLSTLRNKMLSGKTLSALISLSCWESAHFIEPHTPTPQERMLTISNLQRAGIPSFIAVRPILPQVLDTEYERIIEEGLYAGCQGFVLGPLYADKKGHFVKFIPATLLEQVSHERVRVSWSAHAPIWTRYEDQARLDRMIQMVEKKGGRVFLSSVDAIEFLHEERYSLDRS